MCVSLTDIKGIPNKTIDELQTYHDCQFLIKLLCPISCFILNLYLMITLFATFLFYMESILSLTHVSCQVSYFSKFRVNVFRIWKLSIAQEKKMCPFSLSAGLVITLDSLVLLQLFSVAFLMQHQCCLGQMSTAVRR